jgi:glycosyltransferase involved in cell wall biosynthesis
VLQFHLWITHRKQDPYHKWLYDPLDQVWCSTDTARDKLAELLPVDRQRIRVINYGRDVSALLKLAQERLSLRAELDQKFALPPQSVVAICVARIERIKGINELVRAFAQVAVTRPHSHLVIVGGVSPENHDAEVYADQIKDYIGELPASLKGRIHMPGPLNQVERLIAAADIYVLPSYEECVSLALLDAMILGLPLVGTNTGGTPSVVRHGENGELVMAESIEDLAMGLERLLDDPQRRNQYGAAGATRGGEYDRDRVLAQMIKNYLHI